VKTTTLKELNDKKEIDFSEFIRNLKTHEMKMKVREEKEPQKKKSIPFKATPSSIKEEESSKDSDEDFAMLIRRVGKMFYKKGTSEEEGRPQGRFEKKEEEMCSYYYYKKTRNLITDCPSLQATTSKKVHKKKMTMVSHVRRFENRIRRRNRHHTLLLHEK